MEGPFPFFWLSWCASVMAEGRKFSGNEHSKVALFFKQIKAFGDGQVAYQVLPGPVRPITNQGVEPTFFFTALRASSCALEIPPKTCLYGPCQMSTHCLPHQNSSLLPAVWALMRFPRAISLGTRYSHLVTVRRRARGREDTRGQTRGAEQSRG